MSSLSYKYYKNFLSLNDSFPHYDNIRIISKIMKVVYPEEEFKENTKDEKYYVYNYMNSFKFFFTKNMVGLSTVPSKIIKNIIANSHTRDFIPKEYVHYLELLENPCTFQNEYGLICVTPHDFLYLFIPSFDLCTPKSMHFSSIFQSQFCHDIIQHVTLSIPYDNTLTLMLNPKQNKNCSVYKQPDLLSLQLAHDLSSENNIKSAKMQRIHMLRWPLVSMKRYGSDKGVFGFETGKHCTIGISTFKFSVKKSKNIFDDIQQNLFNISNECKAKEEHRKLRDLLIKEKPQKVLDKAQAELTIGNSTTLSKASITTTIDNNNNNDDFPKAAICRTRSRLRNIKNLTLPSSSASSDTDYYGRRLLLSTIKPTNQMQQLPPDTKASVVPQQLIQVGDSPGVSPPPPTPIIVPSSFQTPCLNMGSVFLLSSPARTLKRLWWATHYNRRHRHRLRNNNNNNNSCDETVATKYRDGKFLHQPLRSTLNLRNSSFQTPPPLPPPNKTVNQENNNNNLDLLLLRPTTNKKAMTCRQSLLMDVVRSSKNRRVSVNFRCQDEKMYPEYSAYIHSSSLSSSDSTSIKSSSNCGGETNCYVQHKNSSDLTGGRHHRNYDYLLQHILQTLSRRGKTRHRISRDRVGDGKSEPSHLLAPSSTPTVIIETMGGEEGVEGRLQLEEEDERQKKLFFPNGGGGGGAEYEIFEKCDLPIITRRRKIVKPVTTELEKQLLPPKENTTNGNGSLSVDEECNSTKLPFNKDDDAVDGNCSNGPVLSPKISSLNLVSADPNRWKRKPLNIINDAHFTLSSKSDSFETDTADKEVEGLTLRQLMDKQQRAASVPDQQCVIANSDDNYYYQYPSPQTPLTDNATTPSNNSLLNYIQTIIINGVGDSPNFQTRDRGNGRHLDSPAASVDDTTLVPPTPSSTFTCFSSVSSSKRPLSPPSFTKEDSSSSPFYNPTLPLLFQPSSTSPSPNTPSPSVTSTIKKSLTLTHPSRPNRFNFSEVSFPETASITDDRKPSINTAVVGRKKLSSIEKVLSATLDRLKSFGFRDLTMEPSVVSPAASPNSISTLKSPDKTAFLPLDPTFKVPKQQLNPFKFGSLSINRSNGVLGRTRKWKMYNSTLNTNHLCKVQLKSHHESLKTRRPAATSLEEAAKSIALIENYFVVSPKSTTPNNDSSVLTPLQTPDYNLNYTELDLKTWCALAHISEI